MKKFHINRLLKLADHLETVSKRVFNLQSWKQSNCQTTACAVGCACEIPSFRKAGLKLVFDYYEEGACDDGNGNDCNIKYFRPVFGDLVSWDAVEEFFGLNLYEAEYLFQSKNYATETNTTPKQVAKRIRELVKNKQAGNILSGDGFLREYKWYKPETVEV